MLKLKNITKDYKLPNQVVHALKGISLDFRENEFVAILGPSGCGKTTMMNIIGGLDRYTSGDLIIDGTSTKDYKDSDWDNYRNKKIGFVFQNYNLIPHQTVLGNVELALTLSGISTSERKERAKNALVSVGLSDQLHKRPNQLSGGQMQRVAIARALVNSPDILLADEPTGALDTATSKQIMELIKEVAKDKLVIMVTHNPELAQQYATRVIRMLDGEILEDSNPFSMDEEKKEIKIKNPKKAKKEKKTSMNFLTALGLSLKNLLTKKGRTILTSIAGSIGIIGVALILAVSSGMTQYISKLQADTLAGNPITITETTVNLEQMRNFSNNTKKFEKYPALQKIFSEKTLTMADMMKKNIITSEYIDYLNHSLNPNWYSDIIYKTGLKLNIYGERIDKKDEYTELRNSYDSLQSGSGNEIWNMLLKTDFIKTQYDEITEGRFPTNLNEVVLVVDQYNKLPEEVLITLGLKKADDNIDEFYFQQILGKEYKIVLNDDLYDYNDTNFIKKSPLSIEYDKAITVKIVGIIRQNPQTEMGVMPIGIGYLKELYEEVQKRNKDSLIVKWMELNNNPLKNPFTGGDYILDIKKGTPEMQQKKDLSELGGVMTPNSISIYPVDFSTKSLIKAKLDDYNLTKDDVKDKVVYMDIAELIGNTISSMVNVITYVLIAFTSISLLVSSIMIGIITYVSVIERTKEIGILRSIGARKKDITRVFNAETFIIGFLSGTIGIMVTYILSIFINMIIFSLTEVQGIANLSIPSAIILILISVGLTVLSGLLPARGASKKDPVLALRSE